ncbi:MAG: type 4a pilus biogenesis protein PilO [Myxococcales bacterium]|nr:type 4a pilus biogenesis protein PilO [Myxococcales bacterium]
MASLNAAINEFARRPPQFKVAVFGGLAVVLGLLYWQFLLSPINVKRDETRSAISSLEGERDKLTAQEKEYRELLDKRERLERVTKTIERVLPTDAELPAFFEMLDRRFSEAGVEARKVTRKPEVAVDSFIKVPVEIEITGTYLQIKRFFASLVAGKPVGDEGADATEAALEQDRIITVEDFSLRRATSDKRADGAELLVAKFTAATFRQEGRIAPATAAPAAAGGAKPSPTPATNPVSKAKADTTKAMGKSETRAAGTPAAGGSGKAGN